jgi:glycine hydroxymethyltransferase
MHVIAAKAVCFKEALEPSFKEYSQKVIDNAKLLCNCLIDSGIDVVTGKTDNHIVLMDLRSKNLTGKDIEKALGDANITANKNAVPNDPQSPFVTSGIRLGTPAVTTRGFADDEIRKLANWITEIVNNHEDPQVIANIKQSVLKPCHNFPVYK